jgi:hypothetical protein
MPIFALKSLLFLQLVPCGSGDQFTSLAVPPELVEGEYGYITERAVRTYKLNFEF